MSAAEAELERLRSRDRERMRRFRERHPDAKKLEGAWTKKLIEPHRDEYVAGYKAHQAAGSARQQSYDRAKADLRAAYPAEWAEIKAAPL